MFNEEVTLKVEKVLTGSLRGVQSFNTHCIYIMFRPDLKVKLKTFKNTFIHSFEGMSKIHGCCTAERSQTLLKRSKKKLRRAFWSSRAAAVRSERRLLHPSFHFSVALWDRNTGAVVASSSWLQRKSLLFTSASGHEWTPRAPNADARLHLCV